MAVAFLQFPGGALISVALVALATFLISWAAVRTTIRIAHLSGLFDMPTERGLHDRPTPRMGGVGFVVVTSAGYLALPHVSPALLLSAAVVAIVGLIDDVRSLPNHIRFVVQCVCAIAAVSLSGRFMSDQGTIGVFMALLTVIWIVGLTNAFNFMDGSDGIAGGQGLVAGIAWALYGAITAETPLLVIGVLLAASTAGFLVHNWQPASIFMGDAGSTFLGFTFAALPLASSEPLLMGLLEAGLAVWPFVFDTAFTLLRRVSRRENIFRPHRSHLYQRLILSGMSHARVAVLYMLLALPGVAAGACLRAGKSSAALTLAGIVVIAAATLLASVMIRERALRAT